MVMKDVGVTGFKRECLLMQPVSACCTRITNIFKNGYCNRNNTFIQHGRFDLLLENS